MNEQNAVVTKKAVVKKARKASGSVAGNPKTGVLPAKVKKMATKAEQMSGRWTRMQISKAMGISFQHVYNTTTRPTKGFNPDKFSGPKSK